MFLRFLCKLFSCCCKQRKTVKSIQPTIISTTNVARLILQLSDKTLTFEIGKCSRDEFDDKFNLCIESLETIEMEESIQLHDEENNDIDYIATIVNTRKISDEEQLILRSFINRIINKYAENCVIGVYKSVVESRNKSRITYIYVPTSQN
jgi:hypothetical protein